MAFVACGLNHKTAPLHIREKLALSLDKQEELLQQLVRLPGIYECAILATCNRTEIFTYTSKPELLVDFLTHKHLNQADASAYFYTHTGVEGIRHTLRVASGLDSMMIGEPQILGQMKQSYQHACRVGTLQGKLRPVFEYIFSATKRIRNLSGIGTNSLSIAYAAVQLIGKLFFDYKPLKVLVIGSGETATLVAKYLYKQGVREFYIASRTQENAHELALLFEGQSLCISEIPHYLKQVNVVISATACPLPFIHKEMVAQALESRPHLPLFFLDLAMPRDIEPNISEINNVHLYNIDDLHALIEQGMKERRIAALKAEQLVEIELDNYLRWYRSRRAKNMICHYRQTMSTLAEQELLRAKTQLANGFNQEEVLHEFCNRLVKKLVHGPTVGLKQAAWNGQEELLDLVNYLFNGTDEPIEL